MPRRAAEKEAALNARIGELEAKIERLEAARRPVTPQPYRPPAPPAWAAPQGDFGMNYSGPPSETSSGGNDPWGGYRKKTDAFGNWRDPSGILRDADGCVVTPSLGIPVRGREIDRQTALNIALADAIMDSADRRDRD